MRRRTATRVEVRRRDHRRSSWSPSPATSYSAGRCRSRARRSCSRPCSRSRRSSTSPPRCGSPGSTSARSYPSPYPGEPAAPGRDDGHQQERAADPRQRDRGRSASRIFLEGNFYVDLAPGTPSAPILSSGATLPAANTSGPVQLDRVLAALTLDARTQPADAAPGDRRARSTRRGTPAEDATQDPITRNLTGGQALNKSLEYSTGAFRGSAIVNEALLGTQPHDLSKVVEGKRRCSEGLARSGEQLASFVHTFNATMADARLAPAGNRARRSRCCPPLLRQTESADAALDASFGPTQQFARAVPAGRQAARPDDHRRRSRGSPRRPRWSHRAELGGSAQGPDPRGPEHSEHDRVDEVAADRAERARPVLHPQPHPDRQRGDRRIRRSRPGCSSIRSCSRAPSGSPGRPGTSTATAATSAPAAGGGTNLVADPVDPQQRSVLRQRRACRVLGTRPAFTGSPPPLRRNVACYKQSGTEPQLGEDRGRAVKRAIVTHRRDFIAILALFAARDRGRRLHPRAPALVHVRPELLHGQGGVRSASAVDRRPGPVGRHRRRPGRTGRRRLSSRAAHAVVTMNIYKQYAPIYNDATVLLRPRTPLKDMYLSLDPGHQAAGAVPNGGTLPRREHAARRRRRPDPRPRSTPTRATTCCCCWPAAPRRSTIRARQARRRAPPPSPVCAGTFKRFAPLNRDTQTFTKLLASASRTSAGRFTTCSW